MNTYTQVLEFFMENGIQLNNNQIEELKESFFKKRSINDDQKDTAKSTADTAKMISDLVKKSNDRKEETQKNIDKLDSLDWKF